MGTIHVTEYGNASIKVWQCLLPLQAMATVANFITSDLVVSLELQLSSVHKLHISSVFELNL